jgi:hypothetical protein
MRVGESHPSLNGAFQLFNRYNALPPLVGDLPGFSLW